LDGGNGREVWKVETKQKLAGGVGADADLVVVGGDQGEVVAYATDGAPRWRSNVTSEVLAAPRAGEGIVVVRSNDGRVFGLDAASGERKWEYETPLPPLLLWSDSGAALNLSTGTLIWEGTVGQPKGANELERMVDIAAAPIVDGTQTCAVAYQSRVACFDLVRGTLLWSRWSRDASSWAGLEADEETIYLTDVLGAVLALDKSSGATLWKQDKLYARSVTAPVVVGNFIAVGDYQGYVHFFERVEGNYAARVKTDGSAITARPLRVDSNVLVQTRKGGLYSISVK
jgi:outer membrane protein assembly factor BamB